MVNGDAAAAVEMVEHYRYEGVDEVAVIAAFFEFDGPLISASRSVARAARTINHNHVYRPRPARRCACAHSVATAAGAAVLASAHTH
jgi:hypothetical protein